MKAQTAPTNDAVAKAFYEQILTMESQIIKMKEQWEELFGPKYGSEAWWEKEEKEADEDIKTGRLYILNDADNLDKPLNKLKQWK